MTVSAAGPRGDRGRIATAAAATVRGLAGARRRSPILLVVLLAACGSTPAAPPTRSPSADVATSPSPMPTAATPSVADGASEAASPTEPGSPSAPAVAVDPALLSFIPVGGHGLVQTPDAATTLEVARDPELAANATGLIMATYTPDPTLSSVAPGEDVAVVSVVRLRDPSADETWFRGWREAYDAAACANAGGVARNSQTDIGSHTVYIGACAGGSFTYHTRLADGAVVISINSIGPLHLGETVMERLAP